MRHFFNIGLVLSIALLAIGCERVINVDIKDAAPRFVVEGILTDDSTCRVRLSQTSNFNDTINLRGLSNARVTIFEEGGAGVLLSETSVKGVYRAPFTGKPGRTYNLRVEYMPETANSPLVFTSTSTMPRKVQLDSLFVTQRVFLGQNRRIATIRFKDPAALGNAYRFVQYVDGEEETTIFLAKDDLINGRTVVDELLIFNDEYTLNKCDQLRVELQSIDKAIYLFWYSLSQSSLGSSQSASPGNPASNIKGGALGYFSAHTVSSLNIAVDPDSTCSYPVD
ncbi:DUF4249 domain-containing protein [Niabella insulamsoli]|uniref:DUF4249 domain-containing protein n=1 Tax=Niabella insulamsoli TaxID=3144874 RepID=UPI0031FC1FC8